jgi:hypothetical protein
MDALSPNSPVTLCSPNKEPAKVRELGSVARGFRQARCEVGWMGGEHEKPSVDFDFGKNPSRILCFRH